MSKAPFGIVALETSIPLVYTYFVNKGVMTLEQFQNVISTKAAKRFGFHTKGKIEEGYDADLVVLSDETSIIKKDEFVSMGKATPFEGWNVNGKCLATVCEGKLVYKA